LTAGEVKATYRKVLNPRAKRVKMDTTRWGEAGGNYFFLEEWAWSAWWQEVGQNLEEKGGGETRLAAGGQWGLLASEAQKGLRK